MQKGNLTLFGLLVAVVSVGAILMISAPKVKYADATPTPFVSPGGDESIQDVYVRALNTGLYDNEVVRVKAGVPVRLHFSAEPGAGCGRAFIMRNFGVQLISRNGEEQVAQFTPSAGTYEFSCSMRMFVGRLEAV